jgi:predicted ATPase
VLLLAGEPGIGKSRLLQEAVQQAQGWQVLIGGCQRRGGQAPFTPLLPALERHIHSRARLQLQADVQGCAWLVRLLPELAEGPIEPLPPWMVSPEQERRLVYRAVARFLANVAGPAGTLLVLDDLQWAEADALDLLAALIQGPPETPVRVVGAYRETEVAPDHPLSLMVAEWAEAHLANVRPLRALAKPEAEALVAQLCGAAVTPAVAAQVVQRVGGVPFFLLSYAQGLEAAGGAVPDGVPWDLRQSLLRRVQALPEVGRALVTVAAIAGRVVPRALLLAVLALPAKEMHEALESACRAGLLEELGADAYGFVHDVIREVVEAGLGQARRALLHQQLAEALERQPAAAPAAVLAFHYARSDAREQALRYLEQAGDEARQGGATAQRLGITRSSWPAWTTWAGWAMRRGCGRSWARCW